MKNFRTLNKKMGKKHAKPLSQTDILQMTADEIGGDETKAYIQLLDILSDGKQRKIAKDFKGIIFDKDLEKKLSEDILCDLMITCMYYGIYIALKNGIKKAKN